MKTYVQSILLSLIFVCSMPFAVAADKVTYVVNDIAAKLVQQLPLDKKIALKSRSPEETGLPEEFLRQLLNLRLACAGSLQVAPFPLVRAT